MGGADGSNVNNSDATGRTDEANTSAVAATIQGTPLFMAPEVLLQTIVPDELKPLVDVWSVGATVVQMASGEPPWKSMAFGSLPALAIHLASNKDAVPAFPDEMADWRAMSPELRAFLALCFRRNTAERPAAAVLLDHPLFTIVDEDEQDEGGEGGGSKDGASEGGHGGLGGHRADAEAGGVGATGSASKSACGRHTVGHRDGSESGKRSAHFNHGDPPPLPAPPLPPAPPISISGGCRTGPRVSALSLLSSPRLSVSPARPLLRPRPPRRPAPPPAIVWVVRSFEPHVKSMRQIAVVEGEMLEVLKRGLNGWWTGRKQGGSIGFFPQDCVSASPPKLDAIGDNSGGCAKAVRGGQQRREISVGGCGNAEGVGIRVDL